MKKLAERPGGACVRKVFSISGLCCFFVPRGIASRQGGGFRCGKHLFCLRLRYMLCIGVMKPQNVVLAFQVLTLTLDSVTIKTLMNSILCRSLVSRAECG